MEPRRSWPRRKAWAAHGSVENPARDMMHDHADPLSPLAERTREPLKLAAITGTAGAAGGVTMYLEAGKP